MQVRYDHDLNPGAVDILTQTRVLTDEVMKNRRKAKNGRRGMGSYEEGQRAVKTLRKRNEFVAQLRGMFRVVVDNTD